LSKYSKENVAALLSRNGFSYRGNRAGEKNQYLISKGGSQSFHIGSYEDDSEETGTAPFIHLDILQPDGVTLLRVVAAVDTVCFFPADHKGDNDCLGASVKVKQGAGA
jgi:hypothetical protein